MPQQKYPLSVRVGDTVYVWGGDGFTREVTVRAASDKDILDNYGNYHKTGSWFFEPRTFPIPERPVKMIEKKVKGIAYVTVNCGWCFMEQENSQYATFPAVLTFNVPEED